MDDINKQIEDMAEKMEKSTTSPNEKLFDVIKSLGKDGLKAVLPTLTEEDKVVLKAALEEMNLKKAVSFDDQYAAKFVQGNIKDTIIQEDKADDDQDEKLVKPEAAKMDHQGTPTDGWDGQVIKSLEEKIDEVIEKAMEKCKDDKMVMKKLKEKGMDEAKIQGALDKYKAKTEVQKSEGKDGATAPAAEAAPSEDLEKGKMKEEREEAKEKVMQMEEKEHGTKDPKKIVAEEKKEIAMKKSITWEGDERLLKANTQGRNFHFNVEQFVNETIANEPKEDVKKSEGKEDLNDVIAKGGDKSQGQVDVEKMKEEAKKKQNGKVVKSFSDEDLREAMGLTEEEYQKVISE